MQVGDLVTLKGDTYGVVGVIIKVKKAKNMLKSPMYFVSWVCDMCDDAWGESWELEVVCK